MTPIGPQKLVVKWTTRDQAAIDAIRKRFNIPFYTTLNRWSPVEVSPEDWETFVECSRRNFFSIINVKWCKNGDLYSFKSR